MRVCLVGVCQMVLVRIRIFFPNFLTEMGKRKLSQAKPTSEVDLPSTH
jgi:hypothetical protein